VALAYPITPSELTPTWLTERLRAAGVITSASVTAHALSPLGEGVGMMALLSRVNLTYDAAEAGAPATVVAKFAAQNEANRAVSMAFRIYEREALFLRDLAGRSGVPVPAVYAVEFDAASGDFVIIMEDVGGYRMGDQVVGCGPEEAKVILDAIAPLHASFWGKVDDPSLAFVPRVNGDMQRNAMSDACTAGWDECIARFPGAMTPRVRAAKERFLASTGDLHDRMGSRPQTVVHGDVRLDNMMFGTGAGQHPVVVLDWQGTLISAAVQDLGYLFTQNLTTEMRRLHEHDLLAYYHRLITDGGVRDYSLEELWDDYRLAALYLFIYAVVIGGTLDPANDRGLAFMNSLMQRATATIEDLDLLSLLDA
jgi:aminoglycoside phosphotransferase (APT) family kinase protein